MELDRELIDIAYKKLKGTIYFDKTQLPLVNKLVKFEGRNLNEKLDELVEYLNNNDEEEWNEYVDEVLNELDVLVYPKKILKQSNDDIIFNEDHIQIEMEKAQYFIDLPVKGHILGTLWVLTIGSFLDDREKNENLKMYEHSYGNRLRKNLFSKDGKITKSPYLFEPYFAQYESWRNKALEYAKENLEKKRDVLILSLDLKSFFYSVDFSEAYLQKIYDEYAEENGENTCIQRLNDFIFRVIENYSILVRNINNDKELDLAVRNFLPIGFLPSNILSNYILNNFDKLINRQINPVYYGRYVDDIIIVDKVEKNNILKRNNKINEDTLTVKKIIDYYFCSNSCSTELCFDFYEVSCSNNMNIFIPIKQASKRLRRKNEDEEYSYRINPSIFSSDTQNDIRIQNDKVKVFYFKEGETTILLDAFRNQIAKNGSEFRFLPDVGSMLNNHNYINIFNLCNSESPLKFRDVSDIVVDKFSLSKFLGKYRKSSSMISDIKELSFDQKVVSMLNYRSLIENYILWERLLEITIINNHLESYLLLVKRILHAISIYKDSKNLVKQNRTYVHKALYETLIAAINRTSSLCWGKGIKDILSQIEALFINAQCTVMYEGNVTIRKQYIKSCMVNKYILPLPINMISKETLDEDINININLCNFNDCICNLISRLPKRMNFKYIPYTITPQEISFYLICKDIIRGGQVSNIKKQKKDIEKLYYRLNFNLESDYLNFEEIQVNEILEEKAKNCYMISIDTPKKDKIKVAIGNAKLRKIDVENALTGHPNRSLERYQQLVEILNAALKEHVDLLILPENYLPFEWILNLSRVCANNQMGIITGIEHISSQDKKIYNLTAAILPYKKDDNKFAHVVYHHKVHYSPDEVRHIKGYRLEPIEGNEYQLFQWRDLWFSLYCCFELTSIAERALFQSYVDLTIAVEWNQDVLYFSNIVESLCRDLHCYCIQVNSSDFGDSRIIQPTKSVTRDIVKTKGGQNYSVLVDEIDVCRLRKFQCKEFELQKDDGSFKPTPPNFDPEIVELKQNGKLKNELLNKKGGQ